MIKQCKDFIYHNKTLSHLSSDYITCNLDDSDMSFAMERTIQSGDTNYYRREPNVTGTAFNNPLVFELHIMKDPNKYGSQEEMIFSPEEYRAFTRWLTSVSSYEWLTLVNEDPAKNIRYKGIFTDVRPWTISSESVCGLILEFTCSNAFGYTGDITHEIYAAGAASWTIQNESDELDNYTYPVIRVASDCTEYVYICNLSDGEIMTSGRIAKNASREVMLAKLIEAINNYARLNRLDTAYVYETDQSAIQALGSHTAVQVTFTNASHEVYKCLAYYLPDTGEYTIVRGGFIYLKALKDLPVTIDCQRLMICDDLKRMVLYKDIGVSDVDTLCFPRLASGENRLKFYGSDCTFTIKYQESRKVG